MRLVLDTNTVISGLLWHRAPRHLIDAAIDGRIELFTSDPLLEELEAVLARGKFSRRISRSGVAVEALIDRYAKLAEIVIPAGMASVVQRDPDDDAILACAIAAGADIIVSGDRQLRNLKYFQRIPILGAAEAARRIPAID